MQLIATIAKISDLHAEESDTLTAEADDYDTAKQQLEEALPTGWRILSLRPC